MDFNNINDSINQFLIILLLTKKFWITIQMTIIQTMTMTTIKYFNDKKLCDNITQFFI